MPPNPGASPSNSVAAPPAVEPRPPAGPERTYPWHRVLWLTGVDYFSTLGYQPGIALLAAGALAPVATGLLVLVTLFAGVPVYREVARHSYVGQGSIAMLENRLSGWKHKLFVLALLGFATTDFVITMTLSAADAAEHACENPYLARALSGHQLGVTLALLALLAAIFLRGFREAIGLAMVVGVPYIALNAVVIVRGLVEIARRPEVLERWTEALHAHGDPASLAIAAALVFPRLALGLSGFETGVAVMPLVDDGPPRAGAESRKPEGRIEGTGRLLTGAAVLMSVLLLSSSFVGAVLVPEEAYRRGGEASGRALAWLAHGLLGNGFGSLYDASTIAILWFAGASAMAGILNLIPRYLPRFGMSPAWVARARPLVVLVFAFDVVITLIFKADVNAQGGAYATGVLVLMLSAAVAVTLALWTEARTRALYFLLASCIFVYVLEKNVRDRPDGVIIASCFVGFIVATSVLSRRRRVTELRVESLVFSDEESRRLFDSIRGKKVDLVPIKHTGKEDRWDKLQEVKERHRIEGPFAFLHVSLRDDRSEFEAKLELRVRRIVETGNYFIHVKGAVAIANTIAFVSEQIDPRTLILGLTRRDPMAQALRFFFFGEGETGVLVYQILIQYWHSTPEEDVRPLLVLVSD
ncbi:MAG: hypothetical protein WCC53_04715 [Thermoanaerobaculia bacterium]